MDYSLERELNNIWNSKPQFPPKYIDPPIKFEDTPNQFQDDEEIYEDTSRFLRKFGSFVDLQETIKDSYERFKYSAGEARDYHSPPSYHPAPAPQYHHYEPKPYKAVYEVQSRSNCLTCYFSG